MSSRPRSNVLVGCKQSFKVEASKSLFAIGGGWGRGDFFGWWNKVNYGKCANGEQELILARPTICAFVSFFLRCIGIICLTLNISVSIFRKFRPSRKISCFKHWKKSAIRIEKMTKLTTVSSHHLKKLVTLMPAKKLLLLYFIVQSCRPKYLVLTWHETWNGSKQKQNI